MNPVEKFKYDLEHMDTNSIFDKYLYTVHIWYFEKHCELEGNDYNQAVDEFNSIISKIFKVSQKEIHIVGSSKTGFSLTPNKNFSVFDSNESKVSDIDVAIISAKHFNQVWTLIRNSNSLRNKAYYNTIAKGIYNGFIPSDAINKISNVRQEYQSKRDDASRELQKTLKIYRPINYRIYRSWQDLEDYHYQGIEQIKKSS